MRLRFATSTASLLLTASLALAADWPQWRGPDRNEISKESGINVDWSAKKPKLLWSYEKAGNGYSGPAVVGNVLYCLGADDKEFAFALDTNSGKQLWRVELGSVYQNGYGGGPRCTPTVDGDRIYIIRGDGDIHCLDQANGAEIWHKNFKKDMDGKLMSGWGFSESPLVDGDRLICSPGGSKGTIACLNKSNGETIWRSSELKDAASYSSVVPANVDGVRQYIQQTQNGIAGVAAADGKLLWYVLKNKPNEKEVYRTAVIPTPVVKDNYVYATAGYGAGCTLIKLAKTGDTFNADVVYENKSLANHHGGVVLIDGHIYGHSDRGWTCQNMLTGSVLWTASGQGKPAKGSLTCARGHIFCYDEKTGNLYCAEASTSGWKSTGMLALPKRSTIRSGRGGIWTHPVIANGKLYLRDQDLLFCFDVKE